MPYIGKFDILTEFDKLLNGKKTKLDPEMVLYLALDNNRPVQQKVAKAFGITEGLTRTV